jgi:hypothetical protein
MSTNPLAQHFRQPAIYVKLPSDGAFWPDGSLEVPQNRELPVYPMTAVDEISYRTPDALFNGQAVVDVMQSCVPNIKNAWHIPSTDFNSLLIAVRIASYGHEMQVESTCPHCNETAEYVLDLRDVLAKIGQPQFDKTIKRNELEIMFGPMNYQTQNQTSIAQFEQQKLIQSIVDSQQDEEVKLRSMNEVLKKITQLTVRAMANSIVGIRTPQALVTDREHITEFLEQCDRGTYNVIKDHIMQLRAQSDLQPLEITCGSCSKGYQQAVNLDMSSFFGNAS